MARQESRRFNRLSVQRNAPEATKALLAKLTPDPGDPKRSAKDPRKVNISRDLFEGISRETGRKVLSIDGIYQLLPDLELAEQVLVGSILSPKDMTTADLGFRMREGAFHSEIAGPFLEIVKDHFKSEYKIDEKLDNILTEILFTKGAYILAVLPENNLDQIINSGSPNISNESFSTVVSRFQSGQALGILGPPTNKTHHASLESYHSGEAVAEVIDPKTNYKIPGLTVSDSFDVLKAPHLKRKIRRDAVSERIKQRSVSMESVKGLTPEQIDQLYDKEHSPTPTHTVVPQEYMSRPPVGHPHVLELPVESVIPVHSPGRPADHVGYFILLDENHRPVVRDGHRDYYNEIQTSFQGGRDDSSTDIIKMAREAFGGVARNRTTELDQIHKAYSEIIVNDLENRLRNGLYGEEFSIAFTESIQEIMLYRSLKQQNTHLLYVPEELMIYMAYDFNEHGVGRSLITRTEIIASLRSTLLFADTMSGVRNAIGRKRVAISPDPDSLDPEKDISDIQNLILESSARGFPIASPDPGQTLDYLHRAGYDFQINIEGDNYPNTRVEFDDYNTNVSAGNPELEDRLRRMQISSYGLNPEHVDPTQSPDFATSVVNNNLMLARRVKRQQEGLCRWLTKFVRLYVRHSSILLERLEGALEDHRSKLTQKQREEFKRGWGATNLIDDFIDGIELSLPSPDTTREDVQLQALEQHTRLVDMALEAYITEDMISPDHLEADPDAIRNVIAVVRSYYIRTWMERNNILPELAQLTEMEGTRRPAFNILDIQDGLMGSLGKSINRYLKAIEKRKQSYANQSSDTETEEPSDDFEEDDFETETEGSETPEESEETTEADTEEEEDVGSTGEDEGEEPQS